MVGGGGGAHCKKIFLRYLTESNIFLSISYAVENSGNITFDLDLKQKIPDLFSENVLTVHTSEGRVFHSSLWILVIVRVARTFALVKLLFVKVAAIFSELNCYLWGLRRYFRN